MSLPDPSVSFTFIEPNTLNVKFENVKGVYRFFVINYFARINEKKGVQELFKNNSYKHGAHVKVAVGPHTFYLLCGPGLEAKSVNDVTTLDALDALLEKCRNPKNGCKVVEENVYVFDTRILTGAEFDYLYQDGGRKSRKHRNRKHCNRKHCNRKSRNRKHCNRKSRKSRNRKSRRR